MASEVLAYFLGLVIFYFFSAGAGSAGLGCCFLAMVNLYGDNKKISNQCFNFEFYRMALTRIDQKYEAVSFKPNSFVFLKDFTLDFI